VVLRRLSDVTGYLPASERQTVSRELANVVRCTESIDDLAVLRAGPFAAEWDESGAIVSGLSVVMSGPLYQRAGESALRILNAVRSLEDSIVAQLNRRSAKALGESKSEGKAGAGAKKPRGRRPDTDPKEDKRVADAWKTGRYPTYQNLGLELHMTEREARLAVDRHRWRTRKRRSKSRR
jgi:hypothetical protein